MAIRRKVILLFAEQFAPLSPHLYSQFNAVAPMHACDGHCVDMRGTAARLRAKQGCFRNMGASQQTTGRLRPRRARRIVSLATAAVLAFANLPAHAQRSAP